MRVRAKAIIKLADSEKETLQKALKEKGYEVSKIQTRSDGKGKALYYVTMKNGERLKCYFALPAGRFSPTVDDLVIRPVQKRETFEEAVERGYKESKEIYDQIKK